MSSTKSNETLFTWRSHVLAALATAVSLWSATPPGYYIEYVLLGLLLWLVIGLTWLVVTIHRALQLVRLRRLEPGARTTGSMLRWRNGWWVAPGLLLGTGCLLAIQAPAYVAFQLSAPALADLVLKSPDASANPSFRVRRAGLYKIDEVEHLPWCTRLRIAGSGIYEDYGFAFAPRGLPREVEEYGAGYYDYTHIQGGWYEWIRTENW